MEVPRFWLNWSSSCQPTPQPQQCRIQAASMIYTHSSWQYRIFNPLREARGWTHILMDSSQVCNLLNRNRNSRVKYLCTQKNPLVHFLVLICRLLSVNEALWEGAYLRDGKQDLRHFLDKYLCYLQDKSLRQQKLPVSSMYGGSHSLILWLTVQTELSAKSINYRPVNKPFWMTRLVIPSDDGSLSQHLTATAWAPSNKTDPIKPLQISDQNIVD